MRKPITITTQNYFENVIYYSGWMFLVLSIPAFIAKWYVGIIFALLGFIIISTAYKLVIDSASNQFEDYLSILGLKRNITISKFEQLKTIKIKSGKYSQQLNLASISTTVSGTRHSAYLVTDNGDHYLGESKSEAGITAKAYKIAKKLDLEVELSA